MARLFGKEYHESSNSWFFKSSIIHLKKSDLSFQNYLDENKEIVFKFEPTTSIRPIFEAEVEIIYNKSKRKISEHRCSQCGEEDCKHYLSILNYAYKFLTTDMLEKKVVQTYHTNLLNYNEYWQRTTINAKIEIADIYNQKTDKIRFHLKSYHPLEIRIISIIAANSEFKEDDLELIPKAEKQMKALSSMELEFFKLLQKNKCSFSRKNKFFTIYKENFIHFLPILKSLQHKTYIKETGDQMHFSEEDLRINFFVKQISHDKFKLGISNNENISSVYPGISTYVFKKNIVYAINLPFKNKVTKQIFADGYFLQKADLVYLSSIVARQLGLVKCYLDFEDGIEIDEVLHNTPIITYRLYKEGKNNIIMEGILDYKDGLEIPMSSILLPVELVKYDIDRKSRWFYIPPHIKYEILQFVRKFPEYNSDDLEENSQLLFEGSKTIENLKKIIFEFGKPSWNIELSEDLKKEFIYKVSLKPVIKTKSTSKINWFEYDVEYNYKDIKFTHAELKKFFKNKEKFLKLKDGRLLFFENKDAFDEINKLLKKSKAKKKDKGYKLSIYNLPYVYQLHTVNDGINIEGDEYLEEMFSAIIRRKLEKKPELPNFMKPVLRSYQKAGFQWLMMLQNYGMSGILADDMGLGKTVQAIAVLSKLNTNSNNLVICPKTLLFNWAAEIEKFNKSLSYRLYEGSKKERKKILENLNVNILFASYSIIQNDIEQLSEIDFEYIILDEAQHIKNPSALRTKAIKKLQSNHKMALTGTPIENHPLELWSIFDFLMPGYLPSNKKFKSRYVNSTDDDNTFDKLKMHVSPFILRRKKQNVLIELPDKQEQIIYCTMTDIQKKIYLQIIENVRKKYMQIPGDLGSNYIHILAALTKLRQVCNHPAMIEKNIDNKLELSGKIETLREVIVDAVENDKKLLIFSQFVKMLQTLKKLLKEEQIRYEYMDGSTKNRKNVIENFNNNNKVRAFLISLKTGGYGLNLTAADTVIIVDPWWNPMGENQAIDRAHRIGQTKKVMVYKTITKDTIEEKIISLQQSKKKMFESIIEKGQSVIKKMDVEQLRELIEN